jgi:crotonobetainyl-CoA:carnitine CoA-transferase CaiB-like acyl-CoA transferase
MRGLEEVRVLELGEMVSAAYASKLIGDLGAEVIKVEEPGGDPARQRGPFPDDRVDPEKSGTFLALNTNKRGLSLDLVRDAAALRQLVAETDILIHNYPPRRMAELGIAYEPFRQLNPRLVMCSITPFGLTGPHKDYHAYELTTAHGGGWAWLSPGASERPDLPPLKAAGHQTDLQAGLTAAMVSMAAYARALETGQGEHIDLSVQEYVASFLEQNFVYYSYMGQVASRLGQRLLAPWGMFACRDGLIFMVTVEQDQWLRLVELMGNPEWASWEIFQDPFMRAQNWDVLKPYLDEWMQTWTVEELFKAGQERRICFAPVYSLEQLPRQRQLQERNIFVEVSHPAAGTLSHLGPPYRFQDDWWQITRPAPLLGEHSQEILNRAARSASPAARPQSSASRLPLEGIRVVDFSWAWAGPFCAMQLAHLGAEVIRVESQARPDLGRRVPIYPTGIEPGLNRSGYANQWHQGKKSSLLNLSKPQAIPIAKALIETSDVVVENYATGVMERLGLGYAELKQLNPGLIMASISGYGHTGPQKNYMGYGPAIVPLTGLSSLTGYADGGPSEVGISYGDPNGGLNAAVAITAAVIAKKRTGQGQYIDVSLWESMAVLVFEGWMDYAMNQRQPARIGNRDPLMAPHNCFRCVGQDEWASIACGTDGEWRALCQTIGRPELADDARFQTAAARKANEDALEELLTAWTQGRDKWQVTKTLQAAGVAAFPSMTSKDLAEDPHLNARGFFARLEHPEVGVRAHTAMPWRLSNAPNGVRTPAPLIGNDTDYVMRDLLGYSAEEVAELKDAEVLY